MQQRVVPLWAAAGASQTRPVRRVVLAVVHSVASGMRVVDAVAAIEGTAGVQVVFTRPPGPDDNGVDRFLDGLDAITTPWERAVRERFDLVVAADPTGTGVLRGALLLVPAISSAGVLVDHRGCDCVPALRRAVRKLRATQRPDPLVIGLPHTDDIDELLFAAPDVAQHAAVVGDTGYDTLLAAVRHREAYRVRLGVRPHQRLGLVVSAEGPESVLGASPALIDRVATDFPLQGDRVLCYLHPDVWVGHGRRQVLSWMSEATRCRVQFLRPEFDWRVAVVAADYIIGDGGSLTAYAAAVGKPVYLANPLRAPEHGSVGSLLARYSTVLSPDRPLRPQIDLRQVDPSALARRITSAPGGSADALRAASLRLLRLTDPAA
ncbi:hypothetical protein [Actinokineospora inagensis]|uniref:hypothetical protein n=1 Tax=Actinokineospora inagensis TaxID=103730 RepID=UPI0003FE08BD|nr:hypothetical protein [Actinokineospora inagensis]